MNMIELKNYLTEQNISVKDFAKITKIKAKRLNTVLSGTACFTTGELDRISAFLGVSRNELMHGVTERKGELPEVAEQNNLNHFRYYIKTRLKGVKRLFNLFDLFGGFSFVAIWALYIISLFMGISGLPTILRSADIMLLCFIIPGCGIFLLNDIARIKVIEKRTIPDSKINLETLGISILLLIFSISAFVNDFIPVEALALIITGAVALSVLFIVSPFKNKPFNNRFLQFIVYMLPTAILIGAEAFIRNYVVDITPEEEGAVGEALATASDMFCMVFALLIFGVFYFSMVQYCNVFVKGAGKYFIPYKREGAISKGKLTRYIIAYVLVACVVFLSVLASQGIFLKYIFTNTLAEQEESVNWTADFITDYDNQFKKGEYQVVEYEGMRVKIPKGYKLDKATEYTITYKKDDQNAIIFQIPIESGLENSDYAEEVLTAEQRDLIKASFIKEYGFYPETIYEWQKIMGMVTSEDIDIFNPQKTAVLYSVLTMKAVATTGDFSYYLYEKDGMYASITSHLVENNESGNRDVVMISFGSMDLEYGIMFTHPAQEEAATVDKIEKIINSIEQNKTQK